MATLKQVWPIPVRSRSLCKTLRRPWCYGGTDVDLVTGTESFPNVTQSETFSTANPDDPNQVVVAYNDSRGVNANPINISSISFSTDGGTTFTRLTCHGALSTIPLVIRLFSTTSQPRLGLLSGSMATRAAPWAGISPPIPRTQIAGPISAFTRAAATTASLAGQTTTRALPSSGTCIFPGTTLTWVRGALVVSRSTDNGSTWSSAITVANTGTFIRNTQITGDMSGNGTIYIAGMDEGGGGFPHNDTNLIYKSTDGGATWSNTYTGTPFPGPGVTSAGYFACMFNDNAIGAYWRHEGWGEPAAFNNIVHLVYSQQGAAGDPGDVYYIRSTDGGVTFGTPFKLNTDSTTRPQWQANLSVSPTGTLLATWYDARESTDCVVGDENTPCYRMWSRKSNDNGLTWLPDDMLSDVVSPLPAQPDPGIVSVYVGDYDYGSAIATKHVTSWADGRVAINSQSQQDAFTDRDAGWFFCHHR